MKDGTMTAPSPTKKTTGKAATLNGTSSQHQTSGFDWALLKQALPCTMYLTSEEEVKKLLQPGKEKQLQKLLAAISAWELVLGDGTVNSARAALTKAEGLASAKKEIFSNNKAAALAQTREMEINWRCLDGFFGNAGQRSPQDVVILNASAADIASESSFQEAIEDELQEYYDRVSLKDAYSMLVVPGWLGSRTLLEEMTKIANRAMCLLFTDFADVTADEAEEALYDQELGGSEDHWASAVMFFNAIAARAQAEDFGETEHLFVPGSAFVAGKVVSHDCLAQPAMGYRNGTLTKALGTRNSRYRLSKIRNAESLKVIPIVAEDGRVFPYSETTMYKGTPALEKNSYPIARVFFQIGGRDMRYFLNRSAGEIMTTDKQDEIIQEVIDYLDFRKEEKDISVYTRPVIKSDPKDDRRIWIELNIRAIPTGKSFVLVLKSTKTEENKSGEWK